MIRFATALGVAAALALGAWLLYDRGDTEPARADDSPEAVEPTPAAPVETGDVVPAETVEPGPRLPPEFHAELAPGEEIALTIPPDWPSGIRCPDGSFLPLLNGVPHAGPMKRSRMAGPMSPVVAKMKEADGTEWYVHADGSKTTSKWVETRVEGEPTRHVATLHAAPVPDAKGDDAHPTSVPRDGSPSPEAQPR